MNTACHYEVYGKVGGGESVKVGGREREKVRGGREWEGEMGRKGGWDTGIGTT